jgi:hypothetical protein
VFLRVEIFILFFPSEKNSFTINISQSLERNRNKEEAEKKAKQKKCAKNGGLHSRSTYHP